VRGGPLGRLLAAAWRAPGGRTGLLLLLGFGALATLAPPFLTDPATMSDVTAGAMAPSMAHPFGTDHLSRDVLSRVINGARISLVIALVAVAVSLVLGAGVGMVAGYVGGAVDAILMRLVDGARAIPRLFLLLLLILVWERIPLTALILVLGFTGWLGTSRLVRGEVLRLRHAPFILAARSLGASPYRVLRVHLLPNVAGPLIVAATLGLGEVILLEAGLSFLGLGVQPPTPSWGGMILEARPVLITAPWTSLFPGLAIACTVLAGNLVGDALQASLDPRTA